VIADSLGRVIAFRIAPGQAHELPEAIPLLNSLPGVPTWVVADRGYSSYSFREHIWSIGARPAIPTKSNEASVACPDWIYTNRNVVERLCRRAALGQAEGVARRGNPIREDRPILHGCALPRRYNRLDQTLTGPRTQAEAAMQQMIARSKGKPRGRRSGRSSCYVSAPRE
jgi:transposase